MTGTPVVTADPAGRTGSATVGAPRSSPGRWVPGLRRPSAGSLRSGSWACRPEADAVLAEDTCGLGVVQWRNPAESPVAEAPSAGTVGGRGVSASESALTPPGRL